MSAVALIIGGGMGGMTTALALQRKGFKVRVFERSPVFSEVGAGITVGPSATMALESLGLGDALRKRSDPPRLGGILHYKTNEPLYTTTDRMAAPHLPENQYNLIHRADLHEVLLSAVLANDADTVTLDHDCVAIAQDGEGVTATFGNGRRVRGDFLIGCDGLRSRVRPNLFEEQESRFTGQVAFRCLVPYERAEPYLGDCSTAVYVGPNRMFVRYLIRQGTVLNCVSFVKTDAWTDESWSAPATKAELLGLFEGWHDSFRGVIEGALDNTLFKWALHDRAPLPEWSKGRVTLLGDSAHPMLPFLGLGAAMAIEDAIVLARACAEIPSISEAFLRYEECRKGRTTDIMQASREQGEYYQHLDTDNFTTLKNPSIGHNWDNYDAAAVPIRS
jgi:salicylate hydroxylase